MALHENHFFLSFLYVRDLRRVPVVVVSCCVCVFVFVCECV